MSGCDTVSYVFEKGKNKSFKVAMADASDLTEMMQFGDDTHDVTEAVTDVCRNFFLNLYGDFSGNLHELRAHMFGRIKGDIRKLPSTENAFRYHMLRALYQIIICKIIVLPRFQNILLIVLFYDHINTICPLIQHYLGKTNSADNSV